MKPYYEDGSVTIYHGDCREVLASAPPLRVFDAVVTSPPYGDIRDYGGHVPTDLLAVIEDLGRGLAVGGVIVWNVADQTVDGSETGESFRQALHAMKSGLRLHDTMIYCKEAVVFPDSNRYLPAFEYVFIFSRGAPKHFNGLKDRRNKYAATKIHGTRREADGTLRRPTRDGELVPEFGLRWNWWVVRTASQEGDGTTHPAQMPMDLARAQISTWTAAGDVVIDPFMGSGTTLRAAKDLGRRAIGIEIEERYCEIAAQRLGQEVLALA